MGLKVPAGHPCATRWRPTSPRSRRWASPRSRPWSAARWAARARWSGSIGHPDTVRAALVLAVGARATADQIGTQSTQIAAIKSDPNWSGGDYYGTGRSPDIGMEIARRFAHLTYRGEVELDDRFGNDAPGRRGPGDRRPLRGAELPGVSGPQAAEQVRRGHLRRADASRCPAMTSVAAAAASRRRWAAATSR